jgi:hypothetical protein
MLIIPFRKINSRKIFKLFSSRFYPQNSKEYMHASIPRNYQGITEKRGTKAEIEPHLMIKPIEMLHFIK